LPSFIIYNLWKGTPAKYLVKHPFFNIVYIIIITMSCWLIWVTFWNTKVLSTINTSLKRWTCTTSNLSSRFINAYATLNLHRYNFNYSHRIFDRRMCPGVIACMKWRQMHFLIISYNCFHDWILYCSNLSKNLLKYYDIFRIWLRVIN